MMSEFIMGNESLKTLSPAFEQRALASGQNSGFTSCTSLLELGELASAGDSSQQLSPRKGPASPWSTSWLTGGRNPPTSPGSPALLCRGPQLPGALGCVLSRSGANPDGGRPTRGPGAALPSSPDLLPFSFSPPTSSTRSTLPAPHPLLLLPGLSALRSRQEHDPLRTPGRTDWPPPVPS